MMIRHVIQAGAMLALLLPAAACSTTVSSEPPPPDNTVVVAPTESPATLVVHWTITEGTDPAECQKSVTSTFEVTIMDANGNPAGTFQQACEAFATSITLNPGSYSGFATLLDEGGQERTTTVAIMPFSLVSADELNVSVDFPSDSFR